MRPATPPGSAPWTLTTPATALTWLAGITISALETGQCTHQRQSAAYRPPPSLQHLITIRQATCSYPGCRRPAIHCDQEHTIPHDQGGRTCECNLAPVCRRHHRAKQTPGWKLDQKAPGIMTWTTPSDRTYTTGPTSYPAEGLRPTPGTAGIPGQRHYLWTAGPGPAVTPGCGAWLWSLAVTPGPAVSRSD